MSLLESGTVLSDDSLTATRSKVSKLSGSTALAWLSVEVLVHSLVTMGVTAAVYLAYSITTSVPKMGIHLHVITGIALAMLLVARLVVGMGKVGEAVAQIHAFSKACRTLTLLSTSIGETLTIQAGAELEKKAVAKFRFELVRLLNLSVWSYHHHLNGNKMSTPPAALKGSSLETETLVAAGSPTLMTIKMVATLIDTQRKAARVSNEQVCRATTRSSGASPARRQCWKTPLFPCGVPSSLWGWVSLLPPSPPPHLVSAS